MKKLFAIADTYIQESDWKTLAMLKFCLAAMGVIIGVLLPKDKKKPVLIATGTVFFLTYVPLMVKFFRIVFRRRETD